MSIAQHIDVVTQEWLRLISIANKYEPQMRVAYTRAIRGGKTVDEQQLRDVITRILVDTCVSSAKIYGLNFDINNTSYVDTINFLVQQYVGFVSNQVTRDAVKRIMPQGLSIREQHQRIDETFGLDSRSAIRIEQMRQAGAPAAQIQRARSDAMWIRGNLLAATETNRAINVSLETLWLANMDISKADNVIYLDSSIEDVIPKTAKKEWITRRDGKVCIRCDPLDGLTARLGNKFDTDYGYLDTPPLHPRCRCFLIVRAH